MSDESSRLQQDLLPERVEQPSEDDDERAAELLESADAGEFERRWSEIQTEFVDEPRQAVERANALVDELMQRLSDRFNRQRADLEAQWDRDEDVSTEDLRVALTRYRSFFRRLLSA